VSLPDPTASAALSADVIRPVYFVWLDIVGDPLRSNTSGADIMVSGSGDPDLDGYEFFGINGDIVDVSSVRYGQGGSETVQIKISGLPGLDNDLLAIVADPTNWRGREARLWRVIRNAANVQQGGFHSYYTGRIVQMTHSSEGGGQVLTCSIESYLAAFSSASNRTYLDQERYDAGDLSARAAIAIANGNYGGSSSAGSLSGLPIGAKRDSDNIWHQLR
jgi:hypothetical protein